MRSTSSLRHFHFTSGSTRPAVLVGILACLAFLGSLDGARAQILWALPHAITNDSDVSTLGTYVDALQISNAANRPSAQTVNGVLFKAPVATTDGTFTLSNISHAFTASLAPAGASVAYDAILHGTGGINGQTGGVNNKSTITMGGLTAGKIYQVEVWSIGYPTTFSSPGGTSVSSTGFFDIGTFTASGTTQQFTFMSTANNSYGTLTDVMLRDITSVPEPSSYAMMALACLGLLGFAKLHQRA